MLLADHLGTATTAVEQSATQPVTRRAFKPYGENRGTKPSSWPDRRSYLGVGVDDANTGLVHLGAREYDQSTGRFLSADPVKDIADPLQMNGYAYSHNSPVSRSDPSGLYDPDQREAERQAARKKAAAQSWRKIWTNRHDTAVYLRAVILQVWDFLHNAGRGRVTTERTSNSIKGGSYKNPGKKPGYADLIYWTDKTVYVWEMKHKGREAEAQGPEQLGNYLTRLTTQLRAKGDNRRVVAGFPFVAPGVAPNKANPKELITVTSSPKTQGLELYTWAKQKDPKGEPKTRQLPETVPENVPVVELRKPLIDAGKLWEGAQDCWHTNVENHDWSNNPFTPNPGTGPLPMPLIPVF